MSEIMTIGVGSSGCNTLHEFLKQIHDEHKIDESGKPLSDKLIESKGHLYYLTEGKENLFTPRCLFINLNSMDIDTIVSRTPFKTFGPDNFISQNFSDIRSWATGKYLSSEMMEETIDNIRRQIELCDNFHGFQYFHNLGGSSGGGFTSTILSKICEDYCNKYIQHNITILPENLSGPVKTYEAILTLHYLLECSDFTQNISNRDAFKMARHFEHSDSRSYESVNKIIARSVCDITSCFRFPGELHSTNLRKILTNMVAFPRMHFFTTSLIVNNRKPSVFLNEEDLFKKLYQKQNFLVNSEEGLLRTYTTWFNLRSPHFPLYVLKEISNNYFKAFNSNIVEWMEPCTFSHSRSIDHIAQSGIMLASCYGAISPFKTISEEFTKMFRRKAFLHVYTGYGMDEMEFTEAESNCNDLICEYQPFGDFPVSEDWDEEIYDHDGENESNNG